MLTLSHTQDVTIYDKTAPDTRKTLSGRTVGPWTVVNTKSPRTKWAVHDTATGMLLFHACPTLTEAKKILAKLQLAGLELEPSSRWDGIVWGDHKSYESESILAIGAVVGPYVKTWTDRSGA